MVGGRMMRLHTTLRTAIGASRSTLSGGTIHAPTNAFYRRGPYPSTVACLSCISGENALAAIQLQQHQPLIPHHRMQIRSAPLEPRGSPPSHQKQQQRHSSSNSKTNSKKKVDDNAPLLNEHLIAELFNRTKNEKALVTADTYEVRLIVERGRSKKKKGDDDQEDDGADTTTQVTTLAVAMKIAHEHSLDLMEVTLRQDPPVIKAVNFDRWLYATKKKEYAARTKKIKEGGGAISDRALKEFKFRAGIADHDLQRKAENMIKYLAKGHAVRVTLSARQRSLNDDAAAIQTTLERVKELVGESAVEARALKANERMSYGSLLLHPNKGGGKG